MKKMKKSLLVNSTAFLLFFGFTPQLMAGDHVMVRCEGMKGEPGGCKAGCSVKSTGSKMMTLEECEQAGGKPVQVEKMD